MKNTLIAIVAAIAVCLMVFAWIDGYQSRSREIKDLKSIIESKDADITTYKDKAGHWHSVAYAAEVRSSKMLEYDRRLVELSKQIDGIKPNLKNLQSLSEMAFRNSGSFTASGTDTIFVLNKDTVHGKSYKYSDQWYNARIFTHGDSAECIIGSTDSIIGAVYWKRKWLLGRRKYLQEIISLNPNTQIIYNRNVTVTKKR